MNYKIRRILDFESHYYHIIYGIQNLFVWFKIIWLDRNWDHEYFYELLLFKIRRMIFHRESGCVLPYEGEEIDLKYMKICEKLLYEIIHKGEDFNQEEYKKIEDKTKYWDNVHKRERKIRHLLFYIFEQKLDYWWD